LNSLDEGTFKNMQDNQKLCIEYKEYSNLCKKLFNNCINDPHRYIDNYDSFIIVFVMQKEGTGRLDFIQNMEYKFIELLSIDFMNSSDDVVRKQIAYRYNALKSKISLMQSKLNDINALVKLKNPSLLLQIQKNPNKIQQNTSKIGLQK